MFVRNLTIASDHEASSRRMFVAPNHARMSSSELKAFSAPVAASTFAANPK